jgi:hydrogenase maturation factor
VACAADDANRVLKTFKDEGFVAARIIGRMVSENLQVVVR